MIKIKLIISLVSFIIVSCNDNIKKENQSEMTPVQNPIQQSTNSGNSLDSMEDLNRIYPKKYSFVVFEGTGYRGNERVCTDIFERNTFMDKDEEFKILDNAQQNPMVNVHLRSIEKRYLVTRDSYSEASSRREELLNINQNRNRESLDEDVRAIIFPEDTAAAKIN